MTTTRAGWPAMKRVEQDPVPRDWLTRPVIDGRPYRRISSEGKPLEDSGGLTWWLRGMDILGLPRDPTLIDRARMCRSWDADKTELMAIARAAEDLAKASAARDAGSLRHQVSERHDYGDALPMMEEDTEEFLDAYIHVLKKHHLEPVVGEVFVVHDCGTESHFLAGTFDRVVRSTKSGKLYVADLKTSKVQKDRSGNPKQPAGALSMAVQLYWYTRSTPYCATRGHLSWESIGVEGGPNQDRAIIISVPSNDPSLSGLLGVDLRKAEHLAALSLQVRAARDDESVLTRS